MCPRPAPHRSPPRAKRVPKKESAPVAPPPDEKAGPPDSKRLDEIVASRTAYARRKVRELIQAGKMTLDGIVVTEPGMRITDPELLKTKGMIRLEGRALDKALPAMTYMLNKPRGTISTRSDPGKRETVMDLVPPALQKMGLSPVGRLDAETTGLLLLSSDGDLIYQLTHPRHDVGKSYRLRIKGRLLPRQRYRLEHGVILDDVPTRPAKVTQIRNERDSTAFTMTIFEGRNRQIRDMCGKVGLKLITLHRFAVGPLELGHLKPGEWRELTGEELSELTKNMGPAAPPETAARRGRPGSHSRPRGRTGSGGPKRASRRNTGPARRSRPGGKPPGRKRAGDRKPGSGSPPNRRRSKPRPGVQRRPKKQ